MLRQTARRRADAAWGSRNQQSPAKPRGAGGFQEQVIINNTPPATTQPAPATLKPTPSAAAQKRGALEWRRAALQEEYDTISAQITNMIDVVVRKRQERQAEQSLRRSRALSAIGRSLSRREFSYE